MLVRVDDIQSKKTVITDGVARCSQCKRCYIIKDGIIDMLPNNLISEKECSLSSSCSLDCSSTSKQTDQEKLSSIASIKKSEMDARDEQAPVYHTYGYWLHGKNEEKSIVDFLHISTNDTVLELGCGTGRITKRIIDGRFSNYISVDFSILSIKRLVDEIDEESRNKILFIRGDVCDLPLKNRVADKILTAQVLEHIPGTNEQTNFIKECCRLLKPNGLIALTVYNYNLKKRFDKNIKRSGSHAGTIYYENFTKKQLINLVKPLFSISKILGINCYFPFSRRASESRQMLIEKILIRLPINHMLGDILFLGLTSKGSESKKILND